MTIIYKNSSDQELLSQSIQGNKQAFGLLYERYLDEIYRYVFFRVNNEMEAEDLTEQVFINAWIALHKRPQKRKIENIRAWIYKIAHNLVIDHYRKRRDTVSVQDDFSTDKKPLKFEENLIEQDDVKNLRKVLMKLDDKLRQIIVLRFYNQLSHADTSEIMGLKETHVRVLQYRALKKLRSLLEEDR